MTTPTLPPLPEFAAAFRPRWPGDIGGFTEVQMRAYALAALAQPVPDAPEPAGWFEGPHGAFRANPAYRIAWPPQSVKWHIPVYIAAAHPQPAPQPLTEEQVWRSDAIMEVNAHAGLAMRWLMELVRAIEAAHGIVPAPTTDKEQQR